MRLLVVILVVAAALVMPTAVAEGFSLPIHGNIVRAAVRPGIDVDPEALNTIVSANRESDSHQTDAHRHFDNAPNPTAICGRWSTGIDRWLNDIVASVEPGDAEKRTLKDRGVALFRFGQVTHAIEDFFSHSNYVELGLPTPPPGFLLASCLPHELNPQLQTGYFSLGSGLPPHVGCPTRNTPQGPNAPSPPSGYSYCHSQLNKDEPGRPHHATAVAYATQATKNAWEEVRRRIIAKYESDKTIDAECLFTKFAWGKDRSCHRMWVLEGKLSIVRPGPAPEFVGEVTLEGVKVRVEWTPTRYLGPSQPLSVPVQMEFRLNGNLRATFTNPPQCRGEQRLTKTAAIRGTLKVTPDPDPVEVLGLLAVGRDSIRLTCSNPIHNFTQDIVGYCIVGQATSLVLKPDEEDKTLRCGDDDVWEIQRFTGRMKLDKP